MPDRRYSRRTIVKAAGIAPIMAAGCAAWKDPSERNMQAVRECTTQVPEDQLTRVKEWAIRDRLQPDKLDKFELVVRTLWCHFTFALGKIEIPKEMRLVEEAYEFNTGAALISNLNDDEDDCKFDPFGQDYTTNYCAYSAGFQLARRVEEGEVINRDSYRAAWDDVKRDMDKLLIRARNRCDDSGENSPSTGYGC
jgi:hypothetical protein